MNTIGGTIIHGEGIGAENGYPTANLDYSLFEEHDDGVYAAHVHLGDDVTLGGVLIVGVPYQHKEGKKAEVYIFDFHEDLYGKTIMVEPLEKIREIQEYPSKKDLLVAIENDLEQAQNILNRRQE